MRITYKTIILISYLGALFHFSYGQYPSQESPKNLMSRLKHKSYKSGSLQLVSGERVEGNLYYDQRGMGVKADDFGYMSTTKNLAKIDELYLVKGNGGLKLFVERGFLRDKIKDSKLLESFFGDDFQSIKKIIKQDKLDIKNVDDLSNIMDYYISLNEEETVTD